MITVTLDEITLNATRAALDERANTLDAEVRRLQAWSDFPLLGLTEDEERALVWNIAALHETELAREFFSEVEP